MAATVLRLFAEQPTPAEVARELERLAETTGNIAFARAARALFQVEPPGRPAINDAAAIAEAVALFKSGQATSLHKAFLRVARAIDGYADPRSVAERLRRKFNAQKISSTK